jgi:hypothetical protein
MKTKSDSVCQKSLDYIIAELQDKPKTIKLFTDIINYQKQYMNNVEVVFPQPTKTSSCDEFLASWIKNNNRIVENIKQDNKQVLNGRDSEYQLQKLVKKLYLTTTG